MSVYVALAGWAVVAYALFRVLELLLLKRRLAAFAKEHGTAAPPAYPDPGFGGLKNLKMFQKAFKGKLFPDLMVERENTMSSIHGREVSTFSAYVAFATNIFTSDPRNIQAILANQFADFDLGHRRHQIMGPTLGDGIFVQDGKAWEHSRALLRPSFVRQQISDMEALEVHSSNLIRVIPVHSDGWTAETDIQTLFFRLTIDSATEFLFGKTVDSQLSEAGLIPASNQSQANLRRAFSPNFDAAQVHISQRNRLGKFFWMHNPKEFRENNKIIHEFIDEYVQLALRKTDPNNMSSKNEKTRYVFLEELAERTRDPVELRAQLLNILLAGRDTTASLLSWLFHELLRHPDIFTKLRATILDTFGTYEDPKEISFTTLKSCQYLQHCLSETLRLWAVVPVNSRWSNKMTTLPKGGGPNGESPILVPAGTQVMYSIHVTHRRKDLWGQDADEFKPERFGSRRPGWEFLPFNGGPRICVGQQFALTEASYVVVRLLQRFDQITPGAHELEGQVLSELALTSSPFKHVTLRFHRAQA